MTGKPVQAKLLSSLALFQGLDDETLAVLAGASRSYFVEARKVIAASGEAVETVIVDPLCRVNIARPGRPP